MSRRAPVAADAAEQIGPNLAAAHAWLAKHESLEARAEQAAARARAAEEAHAAALDALEGASDDPHVIARAQAAHREAATDLETAEALERGARRAVEQHIAALPMVHETARRAFNAWVVAEAERLDDEYRRAAEALIALVQRAYGLSLAAGGQDWLLPSAAVFTVPATLRQGLYPGSDRLSVGELAGDLPSAASPTSQAAAEASATLRQLAHVTQPPAPASDMQQPVFKGTRLMPAQQSEAA